MNTAYVLGVVCGIAVVALIAFVIGFILKKAQKTTPKYDERQEAVRGKVFKASYFTLLIYLLVWGSFDVITGIVWCDTYTGIFIGAVLSVLVFAISSIFSGAYFRVGDKPGTFIGIFAFLGLVNLALGITRAVYGQIIVDGKLTHNCISLLVGIMCLVAVAAIIIKLWIDKRAGEME